MREAKDIPELRDDLIRVSDFDRADRQVLNEALWDTDWGDGDCESGAPDQDASTLKPASRLSTLLVGIVIGFVLCGLWLLVGAILL